MNRLLAKLMEYSLVIRILRLMVLRASLWRLLLTTPPKDPFNVPLQVDTIYGQLIGKIRLIARKRSLLVMKVILRFPVIRFLTRGERSPTWSLHRSLMENSRLVIGLAIEPLSNPA